MSKFQHLVVDTSAFIKNVQLQNFAENCYTVEGVVEEIKNNRQVKALAVLPYNLQVKNPDPDILAKVVAFSKKTGDFATLSLVDLNVIALTYELEALHVGEDHLHEEPKPAVTVSSASKPLALAGTELTKGFYAPKSVHKREKKLEEEDGEEEEEEGEEAGEDGSDASDSGFDNTPEPRKETGKVANGIEKAEKKAQELNKDNEEKDDKDADNESQDSEEDEEEEYDEEYDDDEDEDEDEDDDEGWITPSNIAQVKRDYDTNCLESSQSAVACMTTDFAMQNVLKQIGLQIAALDGRVIRQSRTYILRCYACFKTTPDVTKMFCPRCGNSTLKRVAVSLDENGQQVIHINSRRPLTAKFKNRPVAKFTGGKHATNPLLFEDQPLPQQQLSKKARKKTNALGDGYTAGFSPFAMRDVDSRSAVLRASSNLKQRLINHEYNNKRRGYRK